MKKRKLRIRTFRVLAVFLFATTLLMLSRFPQRAVSLERQQEQLDAAAAEYYDAQTRNNQLRAEAQTIDSADFIERTARREYGYSWYGETVYEVGNIDELLPENEFEVYGQN